MLLSLQAPSSGASKELKKLGIEMFDSNGNAKDFGDVIGQLHDKMDKLGPAQREMALKTIFGKNAIQAADTIITKGKDTFEEYTDAMNKSGSASEAAQAKTQGLSGAINRMKALFDSALEVLYIKTAPALGAALNGMINGILAFGGAVVTFWNKFHIWEGVKDLVEGAGRAFQIFYKSAVNSGAIASIKGSYTAIRGAMDQVASVVQTKLLPAMRKMLPEIEPTIKKLGSLFGSSMGLIKKVIEVVIASVRNFWTSAVNSGAVASIEKAFSAVREAVGKVADIIQKTVIPWFEKMLPTLEPVAKKLGTVFAAAMDFIKVAISDAVAIASYIWKHFGSDIIAIATWAWNLISGVVSGALTVIKGIFEFFSGLLSGNWSKLWQGLHDILSGAWQIISSLFSSLVSGLVSIVTNIVPDILSAGVDIVNGLWNGIDSMGDFLEGKIKAWVKSHIPGPIKDILGIASPSRLMKEYGKFTVQGLAQGLTDNASLASDAATALTQGVADAVKKGPTTGGLEVAMRHAGRHHGGTHHPPKPHGGHHGSHPGTHHPPKPHSKGPGHHHQHQGTGHGGGSYAEPPIYVTVNVQGSVWTERQLAKALVTDMRDELVILTRRNGGRSGL
jgi:phage-related protein